MEFNAGWCGRIDCGYVWGSSGLRSRTVAAAADDEEDMARGREEIVSGETEQ